jgi:hypothetical protein
VSKSTLLATRPSRLAPKKCINKSIWLAPGRYLWCTHGRCPPLANQIDLFMHFLGASRDDLVARRVDLDTISSSDTIRENIVLNKLEREASRCDASLMCQHLESPFCHIKEVVNANIPSIYVMYISNKSIFTWELLGNFTYHWEVNEN